MKAPAKGPEEDPRERAAREALAKAKTVPSSNLEGQIAAYAEAMKATEGTSHHREAKEMHEGLLDLHRKALVRELGPVEERASATLQKEEFGAVLAIFEAIRLLHPGPEWKTLIDGKVEEVRKTIEAAYGPLQEKAGAARSNGAEDEVKSVRERVARWGLADRLAELDAHLQGIAPAAPDRPWLPLFDGTTLDFLTGRGEGAWRIENGSLVRVKGKENTAQTKRQFVDVDFRVRFQHRELTDLGFTFRQGPQGNHSVSFDRAQLRNLEGPDHEVVISFRGPTLAATLDGRPVPIGTSGAPAAGHLQFNARGERCVIKRIEYREEPESLGMVGYWTFDIVRDGKVLDLSGHVNDGSLQGGAGVGPDRIGNALQLDGRRAHLSVPASPSLDLTGPFTIAAWIKPKAEKRMRSIAEKWNSEAKDLTSGYFLRLNQQGNVQFIIPGPGENDPEVRTPDAVAPGVSGASSRGCTTESA